MFRFLHVADIHLDSPLRGLSRYTGAPVEALRGATRRALENMVRLAVEREVAFVVIAGDLYDGDWRDYNTGQFLVQQMSVLDRAGIQVVVISGNHDAQSRLTRQLSLPPNVRTLSVSAPETVRIEGVDVAVHGQGFEVAEMRLDLSKNYPAPTPGLFNLGLLHTSADGREGHANYAPCSLDALKSSGYDYWALGHIHKREVLAEEPWVVFSGNLQGRHIREEGSKGATLVTVEEGRVRQQEHIALDVVRWAKLSLDVSDALDPEEVMLEVRAGLEQQAREAGDRLLAARVELTGVSAVFTDLAAEMERWTEEVRALGHQGSGPGVWIEKVRFLGRTPRVEEVNPQGAEALAAILHGVERLSGEDDELTRLGDELFSKLDGKLPWEWKSDENGASLFSLEALKEALSEVGPLLGSRLSGVQEGAQP